MPRRASYDFRAASHQVAVKDAAKNFPDVKIEIADPIGLDPLVAEVIEQRVKAKTDS